MKNSFRNLSVFEFYDETAGRGSGTFPLVEKIKFMRKLATFCEEKKTDTIRIKNNFNNAQETVKVDLFALKETIQHFDEAMGEKYSKKGKKNASLSCKN